jgi:hypothetical protein
MKIVVVIATTGRPEIVGLCLQRFARLVRRPDRLLVIGAVAADAPTALFGAEFYLAPRRGLSIQRNYALDLIAGDADIIVFVDDDYVPAPGFLEGVTRLFANHPKVVAASGYLIADGIHGKPLTFEQADALIAAYVPKAVQMTQATGTYGCNMAFRVAAAPHLRFDENLPLYGWLEDTDFSALYARFGRVVRTSYFYGVHLGVTSGRTSGVRLGYSQIANPLYLLRKGTVTRRFAFNLMFRNMIANLVRSPIPEPNIDRFGRLRGNFIALFDTAFGRAHPRRVLEL